MGRRGNRDNDGKYLRLTGLWPSKKKDTLWTGKFRNEDLGKLLDKAEEADKAGSDLVFFLWENTEKEGKRDPEFTLQVTVSEDQENGRGRGRSSGSSRRSNRDDRDNDNDTDSNQDDRDNDTEDQEDEPEEKPERSSRSSKSSNGKKEEPRSRRAGSSKKDKNNW